MKRRKIVSRRTRRTGVKSGIKGRGAGQRSAFARKPRTGQGKLRSRKRRAVGRNRRTGAEYTQSYNEGYNAGFSKGFEDGHQIAYEQQA
ncbi:hypothetical protein [Cohnella sp. GCM10027633]|uniref:hypothetical protein n=1 Tax=unclassified Cohnella TaxID=2636738 RepID=UPI003624F4CC